MTPVPPVPLRPGVLLTVACVLAFAGSPAARAACPANAGAVGTPSTFWGKLRPTDVGSVPDARDTTEYVGGAQLTNYQYPLFSSVDVEDGYAFTSYAMGFHIWGLNGSNAADPGMVTYRDQGNYGQYAKSFLKNIGHQEQRWLLWDIDAPPGSADMVAMTGVAPFGIAIWDTSNKQIPKILYQDEGRSAHQVFSTAIGGRYYAFTASSGPGATESGLLMYDMSRAKELYGTSKGCLENSSLTTGCGVFKERLGGQRVYNYVDGFTTLGGSTYVVASSGPGDAFTAGGFGLSLWDVTNPNDPRDVLNGSRLFSNQWITGLAAWEQGGRQFLAIQPYGEPARIHEITNCLSKGCSNPPTVWTYAFPAAIKDFVRWLTYSKSSAGTGYLYFGTEHLCVDAVQGEWLFDLSNLTTTGPVEITPPATTTIDGKTVGYWSHYYPTRSTGFNRVQPRVGKVAGDYFYRAAWTLFDVHEISGPEISVGGPATAFTETSTTYTASADGCTPAPGGWAWSTGGTTSGSGSSIQVTWNHPGIKSVSATNTGCPGADSIPLDVQVADADPAIGSVTATPSPAYVGSPIQFTAEGVTGKPPFSYSWQITLAGLPVTSSNQEIFVWNQGALLPGIYRATVTVTNGHDPAQRHLDFSVTLPPLLSDGFESGDTSHWLLGGPG